MAEEDSSTADGGEGRGPAEATAQKIATGERLPEAVAACYWRLQHPPCHRPIPVRAHRPQEQCLQLALQQAPAAMHSQQAP